MEEAEILSRFCPRERGIRARKHARARDELINELLNCHHHLEKMRREDNTRPPSVIVARENNVQCIITTIISQFDSPLIS